MSLASGVAGSHPALRGHGLAGMLDARRIAEDPAHQTHDIPFKLGFGEPSREAAFLRAHVPPQLAAAIGWERFAPKSADFIDSQFRQSESDLLFSAPAS